MDAATNIEDPRVALVGTLDGTQYRVAGMLAKGLVDHQMMKELGVARKRIDEWVAEVYAKLRIDSSVPIYERRSVVERLLRDYNKRSPADTSSRKVAETKRATRAQYEALASLGIDIVALQSVVRTLPEKQREVIGCIVCDMDEATTVATTGCSLDIVRRMSRQLEVVMRRQYVKAIGLWLADEYDRSVELFKSLNCTREHAASSGDMPSETELLVLVERMTAMERAKKNFARCLAEGLDPQSELSLSPATVKQYTSVLFASLKLPKLGPEVRKRWAIATYRRMMELNAEAGEVNADPLVDASAAEMTEAPPPIPTYALTLAIPLKDGDGVLDVSDDGANSAAEADELIARRKKMGYLPVAYVIVPGTEKRYIVFEKRA